MFDANDRLRLSVIACALAATAAPASAAEPRYEMAFYDERPGGEEIARGDYAAAIVAAARRVRAPSFETALVAATNLCVAYTVRGAFAEAAPRCDDAVRLAARADEGSRVRRGAGSASARALSNRGVLRAIVGDESGAARDFAAAMRKTREWDAPRRNLAGLEQAAQERVATTRTADD